MYSTDSNKEYCITLHLVGNVLKDGKFIYNMNPISGRSSWFVLEKSVLASKFIQNTSAFPY